MNRADRLDKQALCIKDNEYETNVNILRTAIGEYFNVSVAIEYVETTSTRIECGAGAVLNLGFKVYSKKEQKVCSTCCFWTGRGDSKTWYCLCDKFVYAEPEDELAEDALAYCDGEYCQANFWTGKDFGCIHWQPIENRTPEIEKRKRDWDGLHKSL